MHAYHVEGAGGGHVPDVLGLVRVPNVLCSSTTPGLPWGRAADLEHTDMILIVHEGNPAAARRRRGSARARARDDDGRRRAAARPGRDLDRELRLAGHGAHRRDDPAHLAARPRDEGVARDELGAGWPDAADARRLRPRPQASLADDGLGPDDNERVLAYLAKHTAEPAIVHGVADEVGSLAPGHLADIVLWEPSRFGVRPFLVIKGGAVAWSAMGEGNASVHGAEPTRVRPGLGRHRRGGGAAVDDVRLGAPRSTRASEARHAAAGRRGARHARAHARRPRRQHRRARRRGLPRRR